jgi:hypothetical protein
MNRPLPEGRPGEPDANAYFDFLVSLAPDRVLPSLRQDLASPDESRRQAAVAYLARSFQLDFFDLCGHLVTVLVGSRTEVHQSALASLQTFGWGGAQALK